MLFCGKSFCLLHEQPTKECWLLVHGYRGYPGELVKNKYDTINLLGHSMGTAIAAIVGCNNLAVGKIIYVCPSFENLQMTPKLKISFAL